MKRDPRLRELSQDHHQALVLARRAERAASAGDALVSASVWDEIERRFQVELAPHFAIEEQCLLPVLERSGRAGLAERTRREHAELRQLVAGDRQDATTRLARFGGLLRDHVRFEERVLFAIVQELLDDAALDAVAGACANRAPDAHLLHRSTQP